jgi:phage tail tape-measure protein
MPPRSIPSNIAVLKRQHCGGAMTDKLDNTVKEAGTTAGAVAGAISGAKLLSTLIPVPFVGPVVGAVVGGAVGSELGRRLGRAFISGGSTFVSTLKSPSPE